MSQTLDRSFGGELTIVDGNKLVGKIVPWGEEAEVFDAQPDGTIDHYMESFERGAFDAQARSGNAGTIMKISMFDEHSGGFGKVGYALDLEDRDDGQYGTFRIVDRLPAIKQMIDDGINGLSMRFIPKKGCERMISYSPVKRMVRTAAHMVHVALVSEPAYVSARVQALRKADEEQRAAAEAARVRSEFDAEMAKIDESLTRWAHLL